MKRDILLDSSPLQPDVIRYYNQPDSIRIVEILKAVDSDFYIYILIEKGELFLRLEEKEMLLKGNALLVLLPHDKVQEVQPSADAKIHILAVSDSLYGLEIFRQKLYYQHLLYLNPVLPLEPDERKNMLSQLERLGHLLYDQPEHTFRKAAIQTTFYVWLLDVADICLRKRESRVNLTTGKDQTFMRFIQLAAEHFRKEHTIDFYADKLCMTPQNLTVIITQIAGLSPVAILRNLLLQEARLQLHDPERPISSIAEDLGFSDQSAFGKFFRSMEGVTPATFRKQHAI